MPGGGSAQRDIADTLESEFVESYHDPSWTGVQYMIQLSDAFKNAGVVVPST